MTTTREEVGSVLFSVLLIFSMVGGSVAFGGIAAANQSLENAETSITSVDSCRTINSSGTYRLTENELNDTPSAGACIAITADSVTFDGGGNAIDGTDEYDITGVEVLGDDVTVANLTIRETATGIKLRDVNNGRIEDVSISEDTGEVGVPSTEGNGIEINGGANNEIRNSSLSNPGEDNDPDDHGISIRGSSGNLVIDNEVFSPSGAGIKLYDADNNTVTENEINAAGIGSRYTSAGIQVGEIGEAASRSNGNEISSNELRGNGFSGNLPEMIDGIVILNGTRNVLDSNAVRSIADRAVLVDDDETQVVDNTIDEVGGEGILVTTDASNTNLTANAVRDAGREDGDPGISDSGVSTEIADNGIERGDGPGLLVEDAPSPPTVTDNVVQFNGGWAVTADNTGRFRTDGLVLGLGAEPVTITGTDFKIDDAAKPNTDLPPGKQGIGIYLETGTNGGTIDEILVNYPDRATSSINESTLRLWYLNGGSWAQASDTIVTPDSNVVNGSLPSDDITVAPLAANDPPVASATVASTALGSGETIALAPTETVTFDASESTDPDGAIAEYRWDFDGDGTTDRATTTPTTTHSYSALGEFDPTVTVVDGGDDTDSVASSVTVREQPIAAFSPSLTPTSIDANTTFDASNSTFANGSIVEYRWDFDGDGTVDRTTTDPKTNYTYQSTGDYLPTVVAVGDNGNNGTVTRSLTVQQNLEPIGTGNSGVSYTGISIGTEFVNWVGSDVPFFTQNFEDPDGEIAEYRWDFDGDGTIDAVTSDSRVSHAYNESGTYNVEVTLVDDDGGTLSTTTDVSIVVRKTGRIAGTVTDASTGAAIENTTAILYSSDLFEAGTTTNATGEFGFDDLVIDDRFIDRKTYNVTVDPAGYEAGYRDVTVAENATTTVDFDLQPTNATPETGEILVTVEGDDKTSIEGATVDVRNRTGVVASATTNQYGQTPFLAVLAGQYTVVVDAPGYASERAFTSVTANGTSYVSPVLAVIPDDTFEVRFESTNAPVAAGDTLTVDATVENTGEISGTQDVSLSVGGAVRDSTEVSLDAGENATVSLHWTTSFGDAGPYTATIESDDQSAPTPVIVREPEAEPPSSLSSLAIASQGDDASVLETTDRNVSVDVENTGNRSASFDVDLNVTNSSGGLVVSTDQPTSTLVPNETEEVTFSGVTNRLASGNYTVRASTENGSVAGELRVDPAVSVDVPPESIRIGGRSVLSDLDLAEGDSRNATANVTNTDSQAGSAAVRLLITNSTGAVVSERLTVLDLSPGETRRVDFGSVTDDLRAGGYDIGVSLTSGQGSRLLDAVFVQESPAELSVGSLTPRDATADNGTTVDIAARIENTVNKSVTQTISLSVGGIERNATEISLDSGENTTVSFTVDTGTIGPGQYQYTVASTNNSASGALTVEVAGGGAAGPVPFGDTVSLGPTQTDPDSLGGKLRVEESVAPNTNVTLLKNSSTEYSMDITAPNGSENVTFYLQERAVSSSQDIEAVQMRLDGDLREFTIVDEAGPDTSPWIAFTVPEFSTRTVAFTSDSAGGETLVVTPETDTGDFDTIQGALDSANDTDTIEVRPGTYEEPVDVNKNVTIVAPDGATIANTSAVADEYSSIESRAGLQIFGPVEPEIAGFTFVDWRWGLSAGASEGQWRFRDSHIRNSSLAVGAAGTETAWTVDNVTITDAEFGVSAFNSSGAWSVQDSRITNSSEGVLAAESSGNWTIENTDIHDVDDAIDAVGSTGNASIRGTTIETASEEGIDIGNSPGSWLIDTTTVHDTDGSGIDAGSVSGTVVIRNATVRDTGDHGIEVEKSTGAWTIASSTIRNTTGDGIDAFQTQGNGTVANVTVTDTENGVNLYNSSGAWLITDTVIRNNTLSAVTAGDSTADWAITQSVLTNGSGVAVDANGAVPAGQTAENYWGAPDGPSGNFNGTGGEALGNLTVSPFYTDAELLVPARIAAGQISGNRTVFDENATETVDAITFRTEDDIDGEYVEITEALEPDEPTRDAIERDVIGSDNEVVGFSPAAAIDVRTAPQIDENDSTETANITMTAPLTGGNLSNIAVIRVPDGASGAERLPVTTTTFENDTVEIEAETPGFSTFVAGELEIDDSDSGGGGSDDGGGGSDGDDDSAVFSVASFDAPPNVTVGDELIVTATVRNDGATTETENVSLAINETIALNESLTLEPDANKTVTFNYTTTEGDIGENRSVSVITPDVSVTRDVDILPPIEAAIAIEQQPVANGEGVFDGSNSVGRNLTYTWVFDDGEPTDPSSDPGIAQPYEEAGTAEVTLIVKDEFGQTDETTRSVTVESSSTDDSTPGFGSLVALLALLTFALLVRRRSD